MTFRELIETLQSMPDHYLSDSVNVEIPLANTDDCVVELEIESVERTGGFLYLRTDTLWPDKIP